LAFRKLRSMLFASLTPTIGFVGVMAPSADASSGIDPYIGTYSFDRTANGSNHDYVWLWDVCNGGAHDYTENDWRMYVNAFNTGSNQVWTSTESHSDEDILAGQCLGNAHPQFAVHHYNEPTFYCCGEFDFVPYNESTTQDDNQDNDHPTLNDHYSVMHESQTIGARVAIHNMWNTPITFANTIEGLAEGWTAVVNLSTIEAPPNGVVYIRVIITSPNTITTWPDFQVWSRDGGSHANQHTTYHVRSDLVMSSDASADQG
jgi:hypothetical protein